MTVIRTKKSSISAITTDKTQQMKYPNKHGIWLQEDHRLN